MLSDEIKKQIHEYVNLMFGKKSDEINKETEKAVEGVRSDFKKRGIEESGTYIDAVKDVYKNSLNEKIEFKIGLLKDTTSRKSGKTMKDEDVDWMFDIIDGIITNEFRVYCARMRQKMEQSNSGSYVEEHLIRKINEEEVLYKSGMKRERQKAKMELSLFGGITGVDIHKDKLMPGEFEQSINRFEQDYPDTKNVAFIMMEFGETEEHKKICSSIKDTLSKHGIKGVRADDKQYHDDLLGNVKTYMYGCGFGVAVYDHISAKGYNHNVSLEAGFMMALRKPVCLLKDVKLEKLPTDILSKIYKEFDMISGCKKLSDELEKWLKDWGKIN